MENLENTMSEQFAIDKAILDEMVFYDKHLKRYEPIEPTESMKKIEPIEPIRYEIVKEGEPIIPDPLEQFKRIYNHKYSIESSSPQIPLPDSV